MAKTRAGLLALALVTVIGVGAVKTFSDDPKPRFCTAEGAAYMGEWLTKDEDCNWTTQDGVLVLDKQGDPVTSSTPPEDLPDGWGVAPPSDAG